MSRRPARRYQTPSQPVLFVNQRGGRSLGATSVEVPLLITRRQVTESDVIFQPVDGGHDEMWSETAALKAYPEGILWGFYAQDTLDGRSRTCFVIWIDEGQTPTKAYIELPEGSVDEQYREYKLK